MLCDDGYDHSHTLRVASVTFVCHGYSFGLISSIFSVFLMVFAIDLDPTIFAGLACLLLLSVGRRDHDL